MNISGLPEITYLTKHQTGLPFDVVKDKHFPNYKARHESGALEKLSLSDIINIHVIMSIKSINDGE